MKLYEFMDTISRDIVVDWTVFDAVEKLIADSSLIGLWLNQSIIIKFAAFSLCSGLQYTIRIGYPLFYAVLFFNNKETKDRQIPVSYLKPDTTDD